jgi:hypothetical protein
MRVPLRGPNRELEEITYFEDISHQMDRNYDPCGKSVI